MGGLKDLDLIGKRERRAFPPLPLILTALYKLSGRGVGVGHATVRPTHTNTHTHTHVQGRPYIHTTHAVIPNVISNYGSEKNLSQ